MDFFLKKRCQGQVGDFSINLNKGPGLQEKLEILKKEEEEDIGGLKFLKKKQHLQL